MQYAIVKHGPFQFRVAEGDIIKVAGSIKKPTFEVLLFSDNGKLVMDKEALKAIKVEASVKSMGRGRKLRVGRFKSKSRYDKVNGSRQHFTEVVIESLNGKTKAEKPVEKKTEQAETKAAAKPAKRASTKVAAPKKAVKKAK
jgi:large subunit ribosomal protein L21